ncbi:MAG TPA: tetratricopeptide repeat protein, partial [Pyrinomonadaceae bacterium]|nr:tetratricopeptide repeat protein [Pyrinomonadaceae bacterium]
AFEKLAASHPDDPEVMEIYGLLVLSEATHLKDPAARKQARVRGREILMRAEKLGANSALLKALLASIPPDGSGESKGFSSKAGVDEAVREGEAAFVNGDNAKAIEMYQRALLLDPNVYEAALYLGDVYFKMGDQQKAGEWYGRAIAIDPDRETAYRYWADTLMKRGRVTEAGDKFVEAYIAAPYSNLVREAFLAWGERVNLQLAHPRVDFPASVTQKGDGTSITLDPKMFEKDKDPSSAAWMMYSLSRATWPAGEFAKQYPKEKAYRHSLKEEASAIRVALKSLDEKKITTPDRSLQILSKLDKEGLLEAYILLAMPDEGIAEDFADYRKTNVAELRRYVKQYVLTGGGQ